VISNTKTNHNLKLKQTIERILTKFGKFYNILPWIGTNCIVFVRSPVV